MGLDLSGIKQKGWYALVKEPDYTGVNRFVLL